jgi:RNase adaptor protein for sRNA GlmZ degradation
MAKGPKGERRPADVNARAVMIAKIATGEIKDVTTEDGKDAAAVALGRKGGRARAVKLSGRKRKLIAKQAAQARWGTKDTK